VIQVCGFARQSGGAATIASEPGQGTTVTLYLPLTYARVADAPDERRTAAGSPLPGESRGCILLVEDNAEVAEVTRGHLEDFGFRVAHAPDAAAAREILRQGDPAIDLVLSDIVMPGSLNGLDLARAVRQEHGSRTPVLLTTGYSDDAQIAADEGFPILRKPYAAQQLHDALARALRAKRFRIVA